MIEKAYVIKLTNIYSSGYITRNSCFNKILLTEKLSKAKIFEKKDKAELFAKKVVENFYNNVRIHVLKITMEVLNDF